MSLYSGNSGTEMTAKKFVIRMKKYNVRNVIVLIVVAFYFLLY